ncbi:hypothetical protein HKX48_002344 [Thoreauomyces humboldtii]|nr:hypothetical protein HKX48_002344 [Thoreauomyces humboldtii]
MAASSLFAAVDAVLVAEFDIDKGSALTFQYPRATGMDTHALSELMLPDGAHLREEDWTMFLLNQAQAAKNGNRDTSVQIMLDALEYSRVRPLCILIFVQHIVWAVRFENEDDEVYWLEYIDRNGGVCNNGREPPPSQPPLQIDGEEVLVKPLTYVLNLVRTKHITGARRGARVKAMAVASRYQWVHVFKPLLVLALDKFFNEPSIGILENLYNSINSMDMSQIPRLTLREKKIFRDSEDNSVLEEKFKADTAKVAGGADGLRLSHGSNSQNGLKDGTSSEGTFPSLKAGNKDRQFFETCVRYEGIRMPVRIPLVLYPEEIGDFSIAQLLTKFGQPAALAPPSAAGKEGVSSTLLRWRNGVPYCWHPHLDIGPQTHPIIVLLNAILTEKRVLFLGDKRPSGEVANYALAACALAGGGGLLRGFSERCFPYISLAGLDTLLELPGYIAGVTNPVFEEQQAWWDVLCNVTTGKITISPKLIAGAAGTDRDVTKDREKEWFRNSGYETDHEFILDAMTAAQTHAGEFHIRQKFLEYVQRFYDVAVSYQQETYRDKSLGILAEHLDSVQMGFGPFFPSERSRSKDFPTWLQRRPTRSLDPRHIVALLRSGTIQDSAKVVDLFFALQDVYGMADETMVEELLSLLPQSQGGLFPIATGLLFGRWEARRACVRLLRRIGWDQIGQKFIAHLNPMMRMAYLRAHEEFYGTEEVPGLNTAEGNRLYAPLEGARLGGVTPQASFESLRSILDPSNNEASLTVPGRSATSTPLLSRSGNSTPPSVPVSPIVKRMLAQQQQRQDLLKAKLTALGAEAPSLFQDTLNPEFGRLPELGAPAAFGAKTNAKHAH